MICDVPEGVDYTMLNNVKKMSIRLSDSEKEIIRWHKAHLHVSDIELQTGYPQDFIKRVIFLYDRMKQSNIEMI